jgi:hypothetical protein
VLSKDEYSINIPNSLNAEKLKQYVVENGHESVAQSRRWA